MLLVWRAGWCAAIAKPSLSVTLGEPRVGSSSAAAANFWLQPVVVQRVHCNPMCCTVYISTGKVAPGLVVFFIFPLLLSIPSNLLYEVPPLKLKFWPYLQRSPLVPSF